MKHQKHVVVKHFSGGQQADMSHYKKPTQEKSPAEIITHVGTNDFYSVKELKDIANNCMQLAKSVKVDTNKVLVSCILRRNGKVNCKAKEINTHLQDICSSNNLPFITHININPHRHIRIKGLHLNSYGDK